MIFVILQFKDTAYSGHDYRCTSVSEVLDSTNTSTLRTAAREAKRTVTISGHVSPAQANTNICPINCSVMTATKLNTLLVDSTTFKSWESKNCSLSSYALELTSLTLKPCSAYETL